MYAERRKSRTINNKILRRLQRVRRLCLFSCHHIQRYTISQLYTVIKITTKDEIEGRQTNEQNVMKKSGLLEK